MMAAAERGLLGAGLVKKDYRLLPHNIEAEQGLLGALMVDNRAFEKLPDDFGEADFYQPAHGRIFAAMKALIDGGGSASPVTLKNYFDTDEDLKDVGGAGYLADLAASVVSIINTKDYARTIRDLRKRRELIWMLEQAREQAFESVLERNVDKVIETAESALFTLADSGGKGAGPVLMRDGMDETLRFIDNSQKGLAGGFRTGIGGLDEHLQVMPTDLVIVAGRPGMGKSAMTATLAYNASVAGTRGVIFTPEMSFIQLTQRMVARHSGVPMWKQMRQGAMDDGDARRVVDAVHAIKKWPLALDDQGGIAAEQVLVRARRHKRVHGLDYIVVDYLGQMDMGDKYQTKNDQLGEITRRLKMTAKELKITVFLMCQLNRELEKRDNKRPQKSDLRESGNIEQDADIVLFLYREEEYLKKAEPVRKTSDTAEKFGQDYAAWQDRMAYAAGRAEIIIDKFRQGPTAIVKCRFDSQKQCFYDEEGE